MHTAPEPASPAPPLASATVVLLRDAPAGLEVFLLKRHGLSDVLGGAYVFPGGKVDAADAGLVDRLDASPAQLHAALGEPELAPGAAAALHVAAGRELFEETGVLLGEASPPAVEAAWDQLRSGARFDSLVQRHDWLLRASWLAPWSRWITPVVGGVIRKRFDTRFFVAAMPQGQQARHDEHEATEGHWLRPAEALEQYWQRAIELAPPQIMSLSHLARYASTADVLATARSRLPPRVLPEPFGDAVGQGLCYPGDASHSLRDRALPGPLRLYRRAGRFEPEGGLGALLAP